ncbi:MAG TPA: hypothetical protein ENK88_01310 [Campylobacterales bacterium]|nr:hypothetical protein [Campylobacterales bacterium]HHH51715.1 hypothetical protein [Campylobacterales bacterium]
MKIIYLLLLNIFLYANCSYQDIRDSDRLYYQSNQTNNPTQQIALLKRSLRYCYSPEIEANLLIIQAQQAQEPIIKIEYYKEALVSISNFSDQKILCQEQNQLNQILSKLYKPIDKEISIIYAKKIIACDNLHNTKKRNYWWIVAIVIIIFGIIKKYGL